MHDLISRFVRASDADMRFLVEVGFRKCRVQQISPDNIRDWDVSCKYVMGTTQVEMMLTVAALLPLVYIRQFPGPASCDEKHSFVRVVELESYVVALGRRTSPPLPWMRYVTFGAQAQASYPRFAKKVEQHMETIVRVLASELRAVLPSFVPGGHAKG